MSFSLRQFERRFPGALSSLGSSWLLRGTLNFFGCPRAPMMIFIAMFGMAACRGSATTPILSFPAILPLRGCIPGNPQLEQPGSAEPISSRGAAFFPRRNRHSGIHICTESSICGLRVRNCFRVARCLALYRQGAHLVLAYAWNPLLAIEVAGSGHIDIVGALLLVVSAAALVRRWRATAAVALGLAIAVKFLPVVLLPLYWKRVRIRDAALAAAVVGLLYVPFLNHGRIPIGSLGTYVQSFRFNGPVFAALDQVAPPQLLAGLAVLVGLVTATWLRSAAPEWSPDEFAWPMAASLLCAPVVFPWYLLWLLPFLTSASTLLIIIWTVSIIPTYVQWHLRALGRPWGALPGWVMLLEYGCVAIAAAIIALRRIPRSAAPSTNVGSREGRMRRTALLYPEALHRHPKHDIRSIHRGANSMRNTGRLTMMGLLLCGMLILAAKLLGAAARANSRSSRQDLRNRFVGQDRGYPLHLEWGNYRTFQSCAQVGVGAQDRQGHPSKAWTKTASRSRFPTCAPTSAANPTR